MKITFVSGFLNNHLLPICESLAARSDFKFVATHFWADPEGANRSSIERNYVLHHFHLQERNSCMEAVMTADVVIFGGSSEFYLEQRKKANLLSFIYSERIFKKGRLRRFYPPTYATLKKTYINDNKNLFVLCASSYLADDIELLGYPKDKCYKLGYLPFINRVSIDDILKSKSIIKSRPIRLLYVGRLIKLKRIDMILKMCSLLEKASIKYSLSIIGDGEEKDKLERLSYRLGLHSVEFLGTLPIETVYLHMKESNILYLNSNKKEGWGAVVNEALGYGCVVIVAGSCGSAHYLVKDGINGYIVDRPSPHKLLKYTIDYIETKDRISMHKAAYRTIWNQWNAEIASDRLISIIKKLLDNNVVYPHYEDGPLSMG